MNHTIRRVAIAVMVMVIALVAQLTNVQVFQANSLRQDPRNTRMLLDEYSRKRGQITANGQILAVSNPVSGAIPYQRTYPEADAQAFAPVVGYYSLQFATAGVEQSQDSILNGSDDRLWTERLRGFLAGRTPQGGNVELTLNPDAQRAAYAALQRGTGQGPVVGSVAAIRPSTGEVLALASTPSYDPNALLSPDGDVRTATMNGLEDNPGQPLLNHATQVALPPGSTMKVLTTVAAIESGMTPTSQVSGANSTLLPGTRTYLENYAGQTCGGGSVTLTEAFALSCNVPFVEAAEQIGQERFEDVAKRFGFDGEERDVGIPTVDSTVGEIDDAAQLAMSTIGQSNVRATTLDMAVVAATIANGGVRMEPQLIRRLQAPNLATVEEMRPKEAGQAVSPEIAGQVTEMMRAAEEHASAATGGLPGIDVASKTGTAEHGAKEEMLPPYTWYIAFAPGNDVAVAVCIESGPGITRNSVGATVAGPIGRDVIASVVGGGR